MAQAPYTCQPNARAPKDQTPKLNPPSENNPTAQPPKDNIPIANPPMLTGAIARPPLTRTWMKGSPNKTNLLRYSQAGLAGFTVTPFAASSAMNLRGPRSQKIPVAKIMKLKGSTSPMIRLELTK